MSNQSVNIRSAFVARPGYYLLDPDYSQIEFRLSAAIAGERRILQGYLRNEDYYKMTYVAMSGQPISVVDVTPTQRGIGKVLALGQSYDQTKYGLARKLKCNVDQADDYMSAYWAGMDSTRRAKQEAVEHAIRTGEVWTWFGRCRPLPELYSDNKRIRARGIRSVWSTRIQGTAADWMKIAYQRCFNALRGRDVYILMTVHDELLFEVSEKEPIYEIMEIIRQAMEFKVKGLPVNNQDLYPDGFYCPIAFEIGYNWGECMELEDKKNKKGEIVIGFKTWCEQNGKPVNFTNVRPEDIKVSFVAPPVPLANIVIEPRKRTVQDPEKNTGGMDPIDALMAFARGEALTNAGPPRKLPELPAEQTNYHLKLPTPIVPSSKLPVFATAMPAVESEVISVINKKQEFLMSTVDGTEVSDNDFAYPSVVITVKGDLTEKESKFVSAVMGKFKGDHWVHFIYQGKTIRAGSALKVEPSDAFTAYLKKALGERAAIEVYDNQGNVAGSRIAFS